MTLDLQQREELYNLLDLLFDEQLDDPSHRAPIRLAGCERGGPVDLHR